MYYTRALRWVLLAGLSLVFFVPFIIADGSLVPNMFFPFIVGKNFAFRMLVELLLGVYILLALREPKYRPKASLVMWALGAFVLWMAVATVFSVDPIKSFWSNFERMEGYITIAHLFVYFIMVGAVVAVEEWWERLFQISIAAGSLQALYSLGQLMHVAGLSPSSQSGARLDGTFGNAIYLAVFMLFNVFLTLFMLVRQRKSVPAQMVYGVALVLQIMTLYFSQTRGAFLGLIGGLIIAAAYIAWRAHGAQWRGLRKISLWGLGVVAVLIVLVFSIRNTPLVKNSQTLTRMTTISLSDTTTHARLYYIWPMALHGFAESPKTVVLGWGQENFNYVFNKYYNPAMYGQEQWFDRAHNQFLDWLVAGGLPAFALYISLFVLMVLAVVRSELSVPEQGVLLGLIAGYAFNNLTVFDDLMSSVYFFTLLAFVHSLSTRRVHGWMFLSKPMHDRAIAVAAPLVVVAVVGIAWTLNAPGIARGENLLNAIITQERQPQGVVAAKDPKKNLQEFEMALGAGVWPGTALGYQETTEQLIQFSSSQAQANVDPSVKKDTFDLALNAGKTILEERPHDARLELFVGALYDAFGQYSDSLNYLNQALADSPHKQQIQFQIGVNNINVHNIPAAVDVLKKAFDAEPRYPDARTLYAAALIYSGNTKAADDVLLSGPVEQGFGTVYVDDTRMIQVYANTKMFDRLIGIYKNRVAKDPKNAQQHVGLAGAYFTAGDKTDTIVELQLAASLDPSLAAQANSVIKQIQDGTLKPGQ